eukprot:TRINITY_DN6549_c0_g1_i1.p1 TRINITY_DN6549_c0_g1~~TRINITY_DN6549_c0_g1_i1.p1  ORF type:complete len:389 (+),score=55.02 TRINITY_DN6549_c0_g1_i1:141-1307(+)
MTSLAKEEEQDKLLARTIGASDDAEHKSPARHVAAKQVEGARGPAAADPRCCGVPMKWISLLLLVAQTITVAFTMRLSRTTTTTDGIRYLNTTAVFFAELLKLLCSFIFLSYETSVSIAWSEVKAQEPNDCLKLCVPSVLYVMQNNLLFISLSNLSVAVYQVTYQLKILSTAVLSVWILGKSLSATKWAALFMLVVGVVCIQLPRGDSTESKDDLPGSPVVGLAAVLSACMTSGFAGVFLEKLLKQTNSSIWLRNIQLAFVGSVFGLVGCFLTDGEKIMTDGFLQGYTPLVWLVICLQAFGGLIVAAVLKYADNLLKCFGNALSTVLGCLLSATVLDEYTADALFIAGTMLVLNATAIYQLGLPAGLEPSCVSNVASKSSTSSVAPAS